MKGEDTYMYRLYLTDKGESPFSLENPEKFLSAKAIERRMKQGYLVDVSDLPYDPSYLDAIRQTGAGIRTYSKWVNTVVVHVSNLSVLDGLTQLPFVDSLTCVWKGDLSTLKSGWNEPDIETPEFFSNTDTCGMTFTQIAINNGHYLHKLGYFGAGISIAVIDGGFLHADKLSFFDQARIKEVRNFNHENSDPLKTDSDHGTRVLSCMLGYAPKEFIGTAPKADYYLFKTEVTNEEYPVEEDYWIAALEYADSVGVDIVTTSLGYVTFDDSEMNHTFLQLDGQTVPASRAASIAVSKGLLLLNSAGNEGNNAWQKIMVPTDGANILTVGSVDKDLKVSSFSSRGHTADGRIKPDLMAMGSRTAIINSDGRFIYSNGTSYSTPIIAGLTACLWEAFPECTNKEIMQALRETASLSNDPTPEMGYGIADLLKAYLLLGKNNPGYDLSSFIKM